MRMVQGVVKTNKVGSQCQFDVCSQDDWDAADCDGQQQMLIEAMWDSGLIEVYPVFEESAE